MGAARAAAAPRGGEKESPALRGHPNGLMVTNTVIIHTSVLVLTCKPVGLCRGESDPPPTPPGTTASAPPH